MTTFSFSLRRLVLIGAITVAPLAGLIAAPQALAQGCSSGEEADQFTTTCVPFMVPSSAPLFSTTAANPDVPEIDGIPCIGHNSGACIGLAENAEAAGPPVQPRSIISSSP